MTRTVLDTSVQSNASMKTARQKLYNGEKVGSDADKAKIFVRILFQGGHLQVKCFGESFLNGTVSLVIVV